jgi:hypothetical protein
MVTLLSSGMADADFHPPTSRILLPDTIRSEALLPATLARHSIDLSQLQIPPHELGEELGIVFPLLRIAVT